MRGLVSVILVAALAVAVTLGARYNAGYVLVSLHPYRLEMSLNFVLVVLLAAFVAGYVLVRVVAHALRLPSEVRAFRERRRASRAQDLLLDAFRAFLEGRYARAEKAASLTIDLGEHTGIGAVLAARAAHELRAYDRRDRYLARSAHFADGDQTMRVIAQAETLLQERRHQDALAALEGLSYRHTAALRLELRAVQLARQWDRYLEVLDQLEKRNALDPARVAELRRHAAFEHLARRGRDLPALREAWQQLAPRERLQPKVAAEAARAFLALGAAREAQAIIEASLEVTWDEELVALYGESPAEDALRRIERAETWLQARSADAPLLLALGRLCALQRLWGKARSYLEASLAVAGSFGASIALARMLEEVGEVDAARAQYQRSLALAEAALGSASARSPLVPGAEIRAKPPPELPA